MSAIGEAHLTKIVYNFHNLSTKLYNERSLIFFASEIMKLHDQRQLFKPFIRLAFIDKIASTIKTHT